MALAKALEDVAPKRLFPELTPRENVIYMEG
jgi:hypothetical protein